MIGTAWVAGGADADHGGLFSEPGFWVAVAFFLFFAVGGILWFLVALAAGTVVAAVLVIAAKQFVKGKNALSDAELDRTPVTV